MLRLDNTFEVVYLAGFVVGSIIRKVYTHGRRRDKTTDVRNNWLDTILVSLAGAGLFAPLFYLLTPWLDFAHYRLPGWTGWIGTALFMAALVLLWRSHADLGKNWSATLQIKKGHSLVTGGVYQYMRHPMYAAHLLWAIAQALLLANWVAGPAFLVTLVPLCLLRLPREEKMLLDHFGEQYRLYMNQTGRVIPHLWKNKLHRGR